MSASQSTFTEPVVEMENNSNGTLFAGNSGKKLMIIQLLTYLKIIFAIVGMLMNVATFIIGALIRTPLRPYLFHILSLTVSDLIISMGIVLYFILDEVFIDTSLLLNCFKFTIKCIEAFSILVCLCMLLAIAADQCLAVALPLRYQQILTRRRTRLIVLCIWILSFIVAVLGIVLSTLAEGGFLERDNCFKLQRHYTLYVNAILVDSSCPVFIGLYIVIYRNIRELKRRDSQRGRSVSMKKATVTTLLLVVPFVLVYVPVSFYILIMSLQDVTIDWPFWEAFMVVLAAHTAADPVIYAVRVKEIQNGYKRICF